MMKHLFAGGVVALLAGCLHSETPEASPEAVSPPVRADLPVLRDPDNRPITEVPVSILEDIRRQMRELGHLEQLKSLEAAYDMETGKLRIPLESSAP